MIVLHMILRVNGAAIGTIEIRRLEPLTTDGSEYRYEVETLYRSRRSKTRFRHMYADGALVCVRKALEALEALEVTSGGRQ